jgi:Fur family transcriptional regulator, peroxide stress response regulator
MAKQTEFYLTALREAGHRITEQRYIICDYLAKTDKHPTPYEVYADISAHHPEMSRATVYNTLNALQQLGAIVEISFGGDHTHYETDPSPHVNLICLRCHRVVDYHGGIMNDVAQRQELSALQEKFGFHPIATKIDVLGLCQVCQQEAEANLKSQPAMGTAA